jgi:signal transduction histidine kinase/CheY-like chemotaxis protein
LSDSEPPLQVFPAAVQERVAEVARSGAIDHVSEFAIELDTRTIYCTASMRPLRDSRGEPVGTIVVCAEITDRVIAGRLGIDVDALLWSGRASGPGPCDYYNQSWRDYTGRRDDRADSEAWNDVIAEAERSQVASAFAEAMRLRVSTEIEARLRRADGMYRWHHIQFRTDALEARWSGTAVDAHAKHEAETEHNASLERERTARNDAEQASLLKDQFLAAVSHELRAPLTTMLLWERVLRDETADAALRARALDAIHQSALLQSRLVADLIDVSRAATGKLCVDLRPLDLELVIADALVAAAPAMQAKRISLERRGGPLSVEVNADSGRLAQVLGNLLSNAAKFTNTGGHVVVRTFHSGGSIVIEIEDDGCGIDPEFLPGVFTPFSQADDLLTRQESGLGLGLAIARQIVELHHGTIEASSPGHGHGATFTLTLPDGRRTHSLASPPGIVRPLRLDRIRVLVIDDDPRVRDALALLLDRAGAVVETAESAEVARACIAHGPEALVCDIGMPGEDGYGFIRKLRAGGSETPAIAVTAHATAEDAQRSLDAGFDLHIAKPIDMDLLVATIQSLVSERRARVRS